MKLSVLFIALTLFQVSAKVGYSQGSKITMELDHVTVAEAMDKIEGLTEFRFLYSKPEVDLERVVSLSAKEKTIQYVLRQIFKNTNTSYVINSKQIVLRSKKSQGNVIPKVAENKGGAVVKEQEQQSVSGNITDANGVPLVGASVVEKGTTNGTQTDFDGNFNLEVTGSNAVLAISYVGYAAQEVVVGEQTNISVVMVEDSNQLDEVVLVGYGTQKKSSVTGAISTVDAEKLEELPVPNLSNALAGVAPGVLVATPGGKPGRTSNISIRAAGSFADNNDILYVIDGVIRSKYDFDQLQSSDVENLSILKDAAASAIYGARAANGVILVSTKQGKTGRAKISYNTMFTIDEPTKEIDMMDNYENALHTNNALRNSNVPETDSRYYAADELEYFKNNRWDLKEDIMRTGHTVTHNLNIQGGSENATYFIGGNYYKGTGIFDNVENEKYSLRANVSAQLTDNLNVSLNLNTNKQEDEKFYFAWDWDGDDLNRFYSETLIYGASQPAYVDGKPTGNAFAFHPGEVAAGKGGENLRQNLVTQGTIKLDYDIPFVDGLKFTTTYNLYERRIWDKEVGLPYELYNFEFTGTNNHIPTDIPADPATKTVLLGNNFAYQRNQRLNSYQLNLALNYNKTFGGDHNVGATFVYEQYEDEYDFTSAEQRNLLSPSIRQVSFGNPDQQSAAGSASEGGRLGYVGRVTYNFQEKYYLASSFRYDGSAFFRPEDRWGFFPSISGAWTLSKEDFFKVDWVDNLKLKASYGIIGADSNIGLATHQQLFFRDSGPIFDSNNRVVGLRPGSLPSDNITWEQNSTFNWGFDASLFDNSLTLGVDIFSSVREDILDDNTASVSTIAGFALPRENTGRVDSHGFEVVLGYRGFSDDFSYYFNGNFAYATNEIVERVEPAGIRDFQSEIGRPLGLIRGYTGARILRTQAEVDEYAASVDRVLGWVPEIGQLVYDDVRGPDGDEPDGIVDDWDQSFIGEGVPKYRYGATLGAKYKNWSIDVILQGLAGFDKMFGAVRDQFAADPIARNVAFWNDGWTEDNPDAEYPRQYGWGGPGGRETSQYESNFWLEKGDFLRVRNLNIGYNLPRGFVNKLGVNNAKVYFNGTNLFMIYSSETRYDTEAASATSYPLNRSYALGLNLGL